MELRRYLHIFRKRWALILFSVLLGVGAGFLTRPTDTLYQASTTIYVGSRQFSEANSTTNDQGVGVERLARTFSIMIPSQPIASEAVNRTGVPRSPSGVAGNIRASVIGGTTLILVTVTDSDPAVARALANGVSDAFVEGVQQFEPGITTGDEGELPLLPAYVFNRAVLPTQPLPTDAMQSIVVGALFGFVISCAVAVLLDYLDITPRAAHDLERRTGLPVLGVIPKVEGNVLDDPLAPLETGAANARR